MEFWLLAIAGVVLTGISKSGFAGGAGVVAVPLLALVMPVAQATALVLPLLLVMDVRSVMYYWQHVNWVLLRRLLPGAVFGIAIAGLMMGMFSDAVLTMTLGALSILFASWQVLAQRLAQWRCAAWLWSCFSGFSSTLIHAGGPPINIYMLSTQTPKMQWLATVAVFFGYMNLLKLVPYSLNAQWDYDTWGRTLLLFPVAIFGVYLGRIIQERLSERWFNRACRALLLLSGLLLLLKSYVNF